MKLKGVKTAIVALTTQKGVITYDCDLISPRDIADHIVGLGFTADLVKNKDRGDRSYLNHRYTFYSTNILSVKCNFVILF